MKAPKGGVYISADGRKFLFPNEKQAKVFADEMNTKSRKYEYVRRDNHVTKKRK